jgi:hypothetical protein
VVQVTAPFFEWIILQPLLVLTPFDGTTTVLGDTFFGGKVRKAGRGSCTAQPFTNELEITIREAKHGWRHQACLYFVVRKELNLSVVVTRGGSRLLWCIPMCAILGKNKLLLSFVVRGGGACCSQGTFCWHGPLDPVTINVGPPPRNTQLSFGPRSIGEFHSGVKVLPPE